MLTIKEWLEYRKKHKEKILKYEHEYTKYFTFKSKKENKKKE